MSDNKNGTLQDEMENLAQTFQNELDKTAQEADEHPLIQELDEIVEEDEEEEENELSEKKAPAKKSGKKKTGSVLSNIASLLFLLVLMLATAAIAFYASSYTELDSYIYSMKCAESADAAATKINFYNEALGYLEKDTQGDEEISSFYAKRMQKVHELISVATVETEDYAAAMAYMYANLTDEQIASPKTAEFKAFLKIAGVFETVAENCIEKVQAAGEAPDFAALAAEYTDNETLSADIAVVLEAVSIALSAEDSSTAAAAYGEAIAALAKYSTDSQVLTEHYCICVAQADGYAAALEYAKEHLSEEQMAAPVVEEFAAFAGVSDIFASLAETIYTEAVELVGESTQAPAD